MGILHISRFPQLGCFVEARGMKHDLVALDSAERSLVFVGPRCRRGEPKFCAEKQHARHGESK